MLFRSLPGNNNFILLMKKNILRVSSSGTLNPRGSADEAGEWAMITFQNEPSERLRAASEVINVLNKDSTLLLRLSVNPVMK